ncbi:MAG: type II toxin-antitoxin system Phd/YefM family antitoxin [Chloroflexi bacterium]|nr:type II toxin-antitoxin system Phd/YefM family antitoxin [Chloroflexota bacterium]
MNVSEARQQFSQLLDRVSRREARVIVEKSGIPMAAIVSAEDLERLNRLDEERHHEFAILDEIGQAFREVPSEEIEREVARALAETRRENRRRRQRSVRAS